MPSPSGGGQKGNPSSAGGETADHRPPWEREKGETGDDAEGTPSDQVTLEDSEKKKQAADAASAESEDAAAAESEEAVLEDAVESMKRKASEPTLDDPASASAAAGEAGSSGESGEASSDTAGSPAGGSPGSGQDGQQAASGGGAAGDSEAERLNAELNASLGRFDGAMLGERDRVQARAESTGSGESQSESAAMLDPGAPGGGEETEGNYGSVREGPAPQQESAGDKQGSGAATDGDNSSGSGMSTIGGGKGRDGDYTHAAAANTPPPDIPDGTDDDVVARQIREAAMKEKDPELRDKLWDEYRKYVNSAKRKS